MHAPKLAADLTQLVTYPEKRSGESMTFTAKLTRSFAQPVTHALSLLFTSFVLLLGVVLTGTAVAQQPVRDKEYKLINPPQKTESGKKIEVVEFFSYACGHCADFEPILQ